MTDRDALDVRNATPSWVEYTNALEQELAVERRLNRYLSDHTARLQGHVQTLRAALEYALTAVRPGGYAPTPATADAGKVRLGGYAPTLPPR